GHSYFFMSEFLLFSFQDFSSFPVLIVPFSPLSCQAKIRKGFGNAVLFVTVHGAAVRHLPGAGLENAGS
ncbi:MAG: hypothetical protein K5922_07760, partial [Clostridiales bacterium]|nr:hypothetical protein [Clostridiales bacterium]